MEHRTGLGYVKERKFLKKLGLELQAVGRPALSYSLL
jgi:hypothetical protein